MKRTILITACTVLLLAASGHTFGLPAQPRQPAGEKLPFTDEEILAKVYDKDYKTPAGFYSDPALKDANHSLYYHQPNWFAADKDKARKIVEDFLARPSGIKDKKIEETNATPKYFDLRAGKTWYRVHNANWFAPKGDRIDSGLTFGAGKNVLGSDIGTLKLQPVSQANVKDLAEYLWLIRYYNLHGAKVLASQAKAGDGVVVANLYSTQVVYGDFGLKDEISVVKETYRVDGKSGAVTYQQQVVRQLSGKKNK